MVEVNFENYISESTIEKTNKNPKCPNFPPGGRGAFRHFASVCTLDPIRHINYAMKVMDMII